MLLPPLLPPASHRYRGATLRQFSTDLIDIISQSVSLPLDGQRSLVSNPLIAACVLTFGLLQGQAGRAGEAYPTWKLLSSRTGNLPAPGTAIFQTATLVLDINKDGLNDFVIASRRDGSSLVWYQRRKDGWTVHPIDQGLNIEAGGAYADIDRDGDLDLVFGEDYSGQKVYWWENPFPQFAGRSRWVRREIKSSGAEMHHDQIFGDFDGDGREELVFWVQRGGQLLHARIPSTPKLKTPWPSTLMARVESAEGLAKADMDGDGKIDLIGGGLWFKHQGGNRYAPRLIDKESRNARAEAGQLVEGGKPEVVFVIGDGVGRLKWFEFQQNAWVAHDLLGEEVIHGHSLQLADINRDGHLDILCAEMMKWSDNARIPDHPNAHTWIFYGNGRGKFTRTLIASGIENHESRVADLDGDGDLDILGKPYSYGTPGINIWLNEGNGPPTKKGKGPR